MRLCQPGTIRMLQCESIVASACSPQCFTRVPRGRYQRLIPTRLQFASHPELIRVDRLVPPLRQLRREEAVVEACILAFQSLSTTFAEERKAADQSAQLGPMLPDEFKQARGIFQQDLAAR